MSNSSTVPKYPYRPRSLFAPFLSGNSVSVICKED